VSIQNCRFAGYMSKKKEAAGLLLAASILIVVDYLLLITITCRRFLDGSGLQDMWSQRI